MFRAGRRITSGLGSSSTLFLADERLGQVTWSLAPGSERDILSLQYPAYRFSAPEVAAR